MLRSLLLSLLLVGSVYAGEQLAVPVMSPVPGAETIPVGQYVLTQRTVTISGSAGATILFTTNEADPRVSGSVYTTPLVIRGRVVLKAAARRTGFTDSEVTAHTYKDLLTPPTFTPPAGTIIVRGETVTLSHPVAHVSFTTDGSPPIAVQSQYRVQIPVIGYEAIRGMSWLTSIGFVTSNVITAQYSIRSYPPAIQPNPGTYVKPMIVTITAAEGSSVVYTLDGSDPTENGIAYTGPITIPDEPSTTVRALAQQEGFLPSLPVSSTFLSLY